MSDIKSKVLDIMHNLYLCELINELATSFRILQHR